MLALLGNFAAGDALAQQEPDKQRVMKNQQRLS
jgi:hypothetical protein